MIATRAGRFALELWLEQNPEATRIPDPDQLRLPIKIEDIEPPAEEVPCEKS